jgi:hypothetical protein
MRKLINKFDSLFDNSNGNGYYVDGIKQVKPIYQLLFLLGVLVGFFIIAIL